MTSRHLPLYIPEKLPCYPCPHKSRCCTYGTTLTHTEAHNLAKTFGSRAVTYLDPHELKSRGWFDELPKRGMWATTLHGDRCSMLQGNKCIAHNHSHYPKACRAFPYHDPFEPLPQASDAPLCPEVIPYPP